MDCRILMLFLLVGVWSYDFNLLAVDWKPTQCLPGGSRTCASGYLSDDFNIHGLWPSNWDTPHPAECSDSPFYILPKTRNLLMTCWLSYQSTDPTDFWEHEWSKHGTCMDPKLPCNNYLNTTATLFLNQNILGTLKSHGIYPSDVTTYPTVGFLRAFSKRERASLKLPASM